MVKGIAKLGLIGLLAFTSLKGCQSELSRRKTRISEDTAHSFWLPSNEQRDSRLVHYKDLQGEDASFLWDIGVATYDIYVKEPFSGFKIHCKARRESSVKPASEGSEVFVLNSNLEVALETPLPLVEDFSFNSKVSYFNDFSLLSYNSERSTETLFGDWKSLSITREEEGFMDTLQTVFRIYDLKKEKNLRRTVIDKKRSIPLEQLPFILANMVGQGNGDVRLSFFKNYTTNGDLHKYFSSAKDSQILENLEDESGPYKRTRINDILLEIDSQGLRRSEIYPEFFRKIQETPYKITIQRRESNYHED